MASERQIEANQANAKRSTGPKTQAGKARASRNARRHGLSRLSKTVLDSDAPAAAMLAAIAQQSSPTIAQDLIQAKLWLSQIRAVRHGMLAALLECPGPRQMKHLGGLERYERGVRAVQRRVLKSLRSG